MSDVPRLPPPVRKLALKESPGRRDRLQGWILPTKKAGHLWPALRCLAGGARTTRAGSAELALTWRAVTLVVAPQEHPLPVGLGSKRAARIGHEPIWDHATPLTEALHVPLHLEGHAAWLRDKPPWH